MNNKSVVYVKFPKAGLGNMLLTWSRAYVFSNINNLEMHTSSWTNIHFGAWVRRETKKRLYAGYFKQGGLLKTILFFYYLLVNKKIYEPPVKKLASPEVNKIFVFNKIFTDYDFFKDIRPYKETLRKGLFETLNPALVEQYNSSEKPVIGLHIRRGDFNRGSTITPISFFIEVVTALRKEAGKELPVTIFTDAEPSEIEDITKLNGIMLAETKADILDILLLAASEFAVLSIGSTFSYWAGFLSEGRVIKHYNEWHVPFRSLSSSNLLEELVWKKI